MRVTAGFDGMVNYCVEGEAMNRMIDGACRRLRLPVERVFSIALPLEAHAPDRLERDDGAAAPPSIAFSQAAAPIADEAPLARLWTREEARWQCTRDGAVVARARGAATTGC